MRTSAEILGSMFLSFIETKRGNFNSNTDEIINENHKTINTFDDVPFYRPVS